MKPIADHASHSRQTARAMRLITADMFPGITASDARSDLRRVALRASVMMRGYDLDPFGQHIDGRRVAHVSQAEDADHPLALVDHRQAAHLELLHVPDRLGEIIVLPAAMDARGHDIARDRIAGVEAVLRQA